MPHISIVSPVYNEASATIKTLVERLVRAITNITDDYEIILIDDGSHNDAWESICAIAAVNPMIKGIRLARNFGQHSAIAAGLDHTSGDWVVVMDSDLQDRPEVIPELYRTAKNGYDAVFVERMARPEGISYRFLAATFYRLFNFLASDDYQRKHGNFSIISRDVVEALRIVPDRDRFYGGTVRWLGFRRTSIAATHGERFSGKPTYNLRGRFRFALQLIVGYSTRLLYVAIALGLAMSLASFVLAADIVIYKLTNPALPVPGWPSVMTAVFFTAGVTNIMLGLIGIYIADLVERSKGRPHYVVHQRLGDLPGTTTSTVPLLKKKHRATRPLAS
jgi:glycosyltransferase involved in cell wall biosynthesis